MSENNQPDQEKKPDDESILELTNEVAEASEDAGEPIDNTVDPLAATIDLDEGFDDDFDVDQEEDETYNDEDNSPSQRISWSMFCHFILLLLCFFPWKNILQEALLQ